MLHGDACEFPTLLRGYDAVIDWIDRNGYEAAGSPREVWHVVRADRIEQLEVGWRFRDPAGA
jgi:effector-binding domain-containing protein